MANFLYTPEQLLKIQQGLSQERFYPYLAEAKQDIRLAVELYERNTLLCESLYGVLQGLEVLLRNSMHNLLTANLSKDWFDHSVFRGQDANMIARAKEHLLDSGKELTPSRVVTALSFGFWVALTKNFYARPLWTPFLYKTFPRRRMNHKDAFQRLKPLQDLRNRVAHHEPVFKRNLKSDLDTVLETIGWICPDTEAWLRATNTLSAKL